MSHYKISLGYHQSQTRRPKFRHIFIEDHDSYFRNVSMAEATLWEDDGLCGVWK